jgi:hypothetical protein
MKQQTLLVFMLYNVSLFLYGQITFVGSWTANHSAPLHTVGPWAVNTYLGRQDIFCEHWVPKGSDYNGYCLIAHDSV